MTFLWFVIWLLCDLIGDRAPLDFAPVNVAAGFLLFAVACDLGSTAKTVR